MESRDKAETESLYALQVAFQTMKERCQQLQARLTIVEEENIHLRLHCEKNHSNATVKISGADENNLILQQKENIEELKKQKSQLAHHNFMVSSENRQLWKRLTRLTRANKSLGSQLTKISDKLKQHPTTEIPALVYSSKEIAGLLDVKNELILPNDNEDKEYSLEEISLRLINSIIVEKTELEQQYAEVVELQANTEMNLKNIGFTYPEDINTDSLEQLKYHDTRLTQIKEALLTQQNKLKVALQNLKKKKTNGTCNNCKNCVEKLMCQTGTQIDSDYSSKENGATQTSFPSSSTLLDDRCQVDEDNICPLCGIVYNKSVSFDLFHEHVVNHFIKDVSDGFEMME